MIRRASLPAKIVAWMVLMLPIAACSQGNFEKLGTFSGRGSVMNSLVGPGPAGKERIYANYTYASSMDLVAYDPTTGQNKTWRHSEGGAWAMETGPDGRIYLGTYPRAKVLRLDPKTDQLDDLGVAIPGETYIWQFSLGPDRKLYGCTFPSAKLLRLDPGTGQITDLGRMDSTQTYNRSVVAAPDGWVYCGIGSVKANLVAFHPGTGERRSLIPEAERTPGFGRVSRGADGHAYGTVGGKNYRLRDGSAFEIKTLPAATARLALKSGLTAKIPETYTGRELSIFRLGTGPDGKLYGGTAQPHYLLRFDPASGKPTNLGGLLGVQPYTMMAAHGKLYIATYTGAVLQIFDPARPIRLGTSTTSNPAYYNKMAPNQDRPVSMTLGTDGRVYVGTLPSYGRYGGAIAWHDPKTDKVDYVMEPVKDQGVASVCALRDGLLVGSTTIEGGPGTTPRAREAVIFLWDPQTKQTLSETPVRFARTVSHLTAGVDGLVYGVMTGGDVLAYDPKSRTLLSRTKLSQGAVGPGVFDLPDGQVIAVTTNAVAVIRYNPDSKSWDSTEIARSDTKISAAGAAVVGNHLYLASEKELIRCPLPASAAAARRRR